MRNVIMFCCFITFTLPLLLGNTAQATPKAENTPLQDKISKAITKFEQTKRKNWAYQIERYENEEGEITSSIEQFEPSQTTQNQWVLLRINGAEPTAKQQQQFVKQKVAENDKSADFSIGLRKLINLPTIIKLDETTNYIVAGFDVDIKRLGKDAKGKLKGKLRYNKASKFIEEITIVNTEAFSPVFSATIDDLTLSFSFIFLQNSVLPLQQSMKMKGKFAFVSKIDEVSSDNYSNYRRNNHALMIE